MKYILVMALIIAAVTYIFLAGPSRADESKFVINRREAVWDRIAALERQRQDMLIVARGRMAAYDHPEPAVRRQGYPRSYTPEMLTASLGSLSSQLSFGMP